MKFSELIEHELESKLDSICKFDEEDEYGEDPNYLTLYISCCSWLGLVDGDMMRNELNIDNDTYIQICEDKLGDICRVALDNLSKVTHSGEFIYDGAKCLVSEDPCNGLRVEVPTVWFYRHKDDLFGFNIPKIKLDK